LATYFTDYIALLYFPFAANIYKQGAVKS